MKTRLILFSILVLAGLAIVIVGASIPALLPVLAPIGIVVMGTGIGIISKSKKNNPKDISDRDLDLTILEDCEILDTEMSKNPDILYHFTHIEEDLKVESRSPRVKHRSVLSEERQGDYTKTGFARPV